MTKEFIITQKAEIESSRLFVIERIVRDLNPYPYELNPRTLPIELTIQLILVPSLASNCAFFMVFFLFFSNSYKKKQRIVLVDSLHCLFLITDFIKINAYIFFFVKHFDSSNKPFIFFVFIHNR